MKKITLLFTLTLCTLMLSAQQLPQPITAPGQSCTSIMVGKLASKDGSVITSHTCDGRYRTWMTIEPAADHQRGDRHIVYKNTMHTNYAGDTAGVRIAGTIPEEAHTYAYLNTAYPCMNEHQLAIGETTFGGPSELRNGDGMFLIEELQRVALQRCTTAREAIRLIGELVERYGYADGGECITIADPNEVWQMEILGEGPKKIGGIWAAQRIPDDHVGVSANIPRIGKLQRDNPDYFMCSDNIEKVAKKFKLWDGKGEFVFWKAFNCDYANGRNYREREYFILNALAPSLRLNRDMDELPFSVKPDDNVDVREVIELFRSTYEGTDMDMCKNLKVVVDRKDKNGKPYKDTITSPIANPWMTGNAERLYNALKPGSVEFMRTVSVAWCSYSHIIQLRGWLPDAIGGICWMSVDNPAETPRIPIFCGTSTLPEAYSLCGQNKYNPDAVVWKYRRANKLATLQWQSTKKRVMSDVKKCDDHAFEGLQDLERQVRQLYRKDHADQVTPLLNAYTASAYSYSVDIWNKLENDCWYWFGLGF
ncbi:MAG: C69 family dipeptidase [Bacteroidales bacterium]|nr:C69 family dipeptidase [Candidatus Colimorpha onthohippi]